MKPARACLPCLLMLSPAIVACQSHPADPPTSYIQGVGGDYLGQAPPGAEFRRFASGIVPADMYHSVTVSPDGQEIYWADITRGIMVTRRDGDRWTTPALVPFSGGRYGAYSQDDAPVVSPDNRRLHFNSLRPYGSVTTPRWRFWYSDRTATGWSAPQPMPDVINSTGGIHWQASVASSGTFYFGAVSESAAGVRTSILSSRFVNGGYTAPEPLSVVNGVGNVLGPFIAPDESYIIFNREVGGGETISTYISFKGADGQWLAPQLLPQFPARESAFVTRDGRYVFNKGYWASAQIIEDLRPRGRGLER